MRKKLRFVFVLFAAVFCLAATLIACGEPDDNGKGPGGDDNTPAPASIKLSGMKTSFEYGEDFTANGLVVTVTDINGGTRTAAENEYTVDSSAYDKNIAGEYTIVVTLKNTNISDSYKATVAAQQSSVTDTAISLSGMKVEFEYGERFSVGDLTVTVTDSEGGTRTAAANEYTVDSSRYAPDVAGEYVISVKLKNSSLSKSYKVTVKAEVIPAWDEDRALKILMIGNSFSDDTLEHAWNIAKSLGIETVYLGGLYIGGCTLDTHYQNAFGNVGAYEYRLNTNGKWNTTMSYRMSDAIKSTDWDFISLQQASGSSGMQDTYGKLEYLTNYVKREMNDDCHAKIVWNMTWAYQQNSNHGEFGKYDRSQTKMYNMIVDTVKNKVLPNSKISDVIPCGTAVQNARTSYIGDTLTRDGYHLSFDLGRYIAGLTLIHSLTGLPIDDIEFLPSTVEQEDKAVAIDAVKKAVAARYAITESAYKTEPAPPTVDSEKYTELDFTLEQGFYNSTDKNNPTGIFTEDTDFNRSFLATKRFTPSEIPVGSIIVLARGWQYRPERWNSDAAQATRADNETIRMFTVTPEWWIGYTYRAFNVARAGASVQINNQIDAAKAAFKIYVPKADESEYISAAGYDKLDFSLTQGFYNSMDSNRPTAVIADDANLSPKFFATKRFTKAELPVGSLIVVNDGWGYRPEAWVDDNKQSTRPAESKIHIVSITELWWGNYAYRAFNIFKLNNGNKEVITGQEEQTHAAFNIYIPQNIEDPFANYDKLELELTLGFYDSTLASNPLNIITDNAGLSSKFYATKRFTKEELPIGTILVIESGWQYRPDAWKSEEKQATRPGNTSEYTTVITEDWWGDYTYRAFNISKLGLPVIDGQMDQAKIAFRIYVPKAE